MKKIYGLILSVVLALSLMLIPASAALADTDVGGEVAATPTVTSVTAATGDVNTTPTVVIAGTGFIQGTPPVSASVVSFSGTGITVSSFTVNSAIQITAVLAIGAAADTLAGLRNVSVTIAGVTGTGTGVFTVNTVFTLNVPGNISLGLMTAGGAATGTSTGSVVTNDPSWTVTAIDAKVTAPVSAGYMTRDGSKATALADKFQIGKASGTYVYADTVLNYDANPASLPLFVRQAVASDATAGAYSITITFTSSY